MAKLDKMRELIFPQRDESVFRFFSNVFCLCICCTAGSNCDFDKQSQIKPCHIKSIHFARKTL